MVSKYFILNSHLYMNWNKRPVMIVLGATRLSFAFLLKEDLILQNPQP